MSVKGSRHQQHTSFWTSPTPCWSTMLFHRVSSLPLWFKLPKKSTITCGNDYHPEEVLREAGKGPHHPFYCTTYSSHSSLLTGQTSPQRTPCALHLSSAHLEELRPNAACSLKLSSWWVNGPPGVSAPLMQGPPHWQSSASLNETFHVNTFTVQFIRYTCEHLISTN